jgi:hypothetical protein
MDKRLKQLIELAEEGDENAADDIAREFPKQYEKIFGIPMPKLVKKFDGGIIEKEVMAPAKTKSKPQGVGIAKKGFGRAYIQ